MPAACAHVIAGRWLALALFASRWRRPTSITCGCRPPPAGRGPGLLLADDPAARRRVGGAHRGCRRRGPSHPQGHAGVPTSFGQRLSLPDRHTPVEHAAEFAVLKRARPRRAQDASSLVAAVRPSCRHPGGIALSSIRPRSPPRPDRGFEFQLEPDRRGSAARPGDAGADRRGAEDPAINASSCSAPSALDAAVQLRPRPQQGEAAGLTCRLFTPADVFGSLLRHDFNLFADFRVTSRPTRNRGRPLGDLSRLYVRNAAGAMVPLSTLGQLKRCRAGVLSHYNVTARRDQAGPAPGYSSSQAIPRWSRGRRVLPADFASNGPASPTRVRPLGWRRSVFALALGFVFFFWRHSTSWSMPFM